MTMSIKKIKEEFFLEVYKYGNFDLNIMKKVNMIFDKISKEIGKINYLLSKEKGWGSDCISTADLISLQTVSYLSNLQELKFSESASANNFLAEKANVQNINITEAERPIYKNNLVKVLGDY